MASLDEVLRNLQQQAGFAAGKTRQLEQQVKQMGGDHALIRQELQRQQRDFQNLADALSNAQGNGAGGGSVVSVGEGGRSLVRYGEHVRYIEEIPGRRIPFDLVTDIPIGANIVAQQQSTETISQDGPFVAVARFATFQSAFQFQLTDPEAGQPAGFQGRSFGRFRPIHSAWDVADAGAGVFNPVAGIAFPGTGAPIFASPSTHSSFRTMEFDGVIQFFNQGAAYPRSNVQIPSSFWTTQINSPFQLGALDFFERGETLQWQVTPTHVNNPDAGNCSGFAGGPGVFPFLAQQYDVHEGVCDQFDENVQTDPVQRLPDGILVIGFHGFRIVQPPGPVAMT